MVADGGERWTFVLWVSTVGRGGGQVWRGGRGEEVRKTRQMVMEMMQEEERTVRAGEGEKSPGAAKERRRMKYWGKAG